MARSGLTRSVYALHEGVFSVGMDKVFHRLAPGEEAAKGALKLSLNPFLILQDDAVILLDPGMGEFTQDGSVEVMRQNLAEVGITPEDVTDVVISHLHLDHIGGLAHQEDGYWQLTFPEATHWINRDEIARVEAKGTFYGERQTEFFFFVTSRASIERVETGAIPLRGWSSRHLGGHTSHSVAWVIGEDSPSEPTYVMAGDVVGSKGALLRRYQANYDVDPQQASDAREAIKKEAFEKGWIFMAYHEATAPFMRLTESSTSGYTVEAVEMDQGVPVVNPDQA